MVDKKNRDMINNPFIMAGPCSAESEEQVINTARALYDRGIDLYRAGLWKPRTRPNSFEGVGSIGLPWLKRVKDELGMRVTTEVAKGKHVDLALEFGIDVLWLGARTTTNPFSVQEIADAIKGVDIPVVIKNPINPDIKLWLGAIERLEKVGVNNIMLIHRGFNYFNNRKYRNSPVWQIPIEVKTLFPERVILCDVSHICGSRETLLQVAQQALDLEFDGLMIEVHPDPDNALSDAKQQVTPDQYDQIMNSLVLRRTRIDEGGVQEEINILRQHIDELDDNLIHMFKKRMEYVESIGELKRAHDIPILQPGRWKDIIYHAIDKAKESELSKDFIERIFKAIHQESINHQMEIMNKAATEMGGGGWKD